MLRLCSRLGSAAAEGTWVTATAQYWVAAAAAAALPPGSAAGLSTRAAQSHKAKHYRGSEAGPPAFVFDIDGCLLVGHNVLPQAKSALHQLYHGDRDRPMCPIVFLTNGGGRGLRSSCSNAAGLLLLGAPCERLPISRSHRGACMIVPQVG